MNRPSPAMKTRRRPSRSPARAPSSSRPPKVSVYAFWTQDSPVGEKPRSVWISGRAVMTIDASSTIISWTVRMIARTTVGVSGAAAKAGHCMAGP